MALPPKFKGHRLVFADDLSSEPLHTMEVYLDYLCPFSAKMFRTLHTGLAPLLRADASLGSRVQVLFRQQVQPWHPSSALTHEAALAVQRLAPARFWDFSAALFDAQRQYFDLAVSAEPRNATYARLADLAAASAGLPAADVLALLRVRELAPGEPAPAAPAELNSGNAVTADMKTIVKMARLVGVHVSPTVIFDGVVASDISSSWTAEQLVDFLKKNMA